MRKVLFFCLAFLLIYPLGAVAEFPSNGKRDAYAKDLLKIKLTSEAARLAELPQGFNASTTSFGINELDQLMSVTGGQMVIRAHRRVKDSAWEARTGFDRWFLIKLSGKMDVEEALTAFKQNRYIEKTTFEYLAYPTAVPNDTYYANNWGHNNTAQLPAYTSSGHTGPGVGLVGFDSDAQLAWDQSQGYGSPSIVIAIIDTGVDITHPDLRLVTGYDYGDNDSDPMDDSADPGHGTACSGVAAGIANNGIGVTGIAGGCSVMPLKVADSAGDMYFTAIENAVTHAADNNAHIISMSLGADEMEEGDSPSTDAALTYAYNAGVAIFAATANGNTSPISYPSNHTVVISVGAASPCGERKSDTSCDGEYWWGSNYGTAVQDDKDAVDIMAPTILPATDITGSGGYSSTDYSMWFNGTSCATPYAAGVGALVLSRDPSLTPSELRSVLTSTATDMTLDGGAGWDRYTGYGMVNAYAALADPPIITWSPSSFYQELPPDDIAAQNLTIGNTGERILEFSASKPASSTTVFFEGFENGGSIPTGWSQEYVSGSTSWIFTSGGHSGNPASAYEGSYNAQLYLGSWNGVTTRLVTPSLDLSSATAPTLTFWHTQAAWSGDQDQLKVYYKTSSGSAWNQLAHYTSNITSWTQESLTLPNPGSTYYLAFEGITDYGYGVCLDNVQISVSYPVDTWYDISGGDAYTGTVSGDGGSVSIPVNFNSAGLSPGIYSSNIYVTSNSATDPEITIPVTLNVIDAFQQHTIPLSVGWNLVSSWLEPDDPDMLSVFADLISAGYLVKVQDEAGNSMAQDTQGAWLNGIGNFQDTEGYYVKVNAACDLVITGTSVSLPLSVPLQTGWNIISYPLDTAQDALSQVQPLINSGLLVKVQNEAGDAIAQDTQGVWQNNIGDFVTGEGYYIKVSGITQITFTAPAKTGNYRLERIRN